MICSVEGCLAKHLARGFCTRHYHRYRRHGVPTAGGTYNGDGLALITEAVASWDRSVCWIWPFSTSKGYGRVSVEGRVEQAHRVACEADGRSLAMLGCHTCDVRACFNPDHIFDGSSLDNMRDCHAKGRARQGHARWKLTEDQAIQIVEGRDTAVVTAAMFGVSPSYVRKLRRRAERPDS